MNHHIHSRRILEEDKVRDHTYTVLWGSIFCVTLIIGMTLCTTTKHGTSGLHVGNGHRSAFAFWLWLAFLSIFLMCF